MAAPKRSVPVSKESLICIGKNICLSGADLRIVADLFLSPNGTVSVAVHSSSGSASEIARYISRMGFSGLNLIASDYFYKTEGQAAGIIDIMARHGHITFSESASYTAAVSSGVASPIVFFVGDISGR